jgi:hypothetical protein
MMGFALLKLRKMLPLLKPMRAVFVCFDSRATHARILLPAALASVLFGFVLVRVRAICMLTQSLKPGSGSQIGQMKKARAFIMISRRKKSRKKSRY